MSSAPHTPAEAASVLIEQLHEHADPDNVAGMARFGISSAGTLGVATPLIWQLASQAVRSVGRDPARRHETAAILWASGVHEARVAAAKVDVPHLVTRDQMEAWALEIDSWDVCDQLCMKCWWQAPGAWETAVEFAGRDELFVKRVAFVLAACFGWKRKDLPAEAYLPLLELVERECRDERNEVKKAVNWALRQIGKRDAETNALAVACADRILEANRDSASARWIARDALRELKGDKVRIRLGLEPLAED